MYVLFGARPAFQVYYTGDMDNVRFGTWFAKKPLAEQMADVLPSFTGSGRTWFVASHYGQVDLAPIFEQLEEYCQRIKTFQETDALAIEYLCSAEPIE